MSSPTSNNNSNYKFIDSNSKRKSNSNQMFPYTHSLQRTSSTQSEYNDGHSLTYSASSSQAGESTDSSEVADIEFLNDVLVREQSIHELESIQAKGVRVYRSQLGLNSSGSGSASVSVGSKEKNVQQSGGQTSASTAHDGGYHTTPHKRLQKISYDSPTMVSTDISCDHTPSTVMNTPTSSATPSSNRKKYVEEKWYSKSWMCGFTDALEALNLKP